MKKKYILASAFLFAVIAAIVVLALNQKASFALDDESKITRVVLSNETEKVELVKRDQHWWIDGKTFAAQEKVANMLYFLQCLQITTPLSQQADFAAQNYVRVEVFGNWGTLQSYQIAEIENAGLVGKLKNDDKLYRLEIVGDEEFELKETLPTHALLWEEKIVFSEVPSNIRSVSVENFEAPTLSYTLTIDSLQTTLVCGQNKSATPIPEKVQRYFSYFYNVEFEQYALNLSPSATDSIFKNKAYRIEIQNKQGEKHQLTVYKNFGSNALDPSHYCYVQRDSNPQLMLGAWINYDILAMRCDYFTEP